MDKERQGKFNFGVGRGRGGRDESSGDGGLEAA